MPNPSERKSSKPLPITKGSTALVLTRTRSAAECSDSPIPDLLLINVQNTIEKTTYLNDEQKAFLKKEAEKFFNADESSLFETLKKALQQPTLKKFIDRVCAHDDKYDRGYNDLADTLEEWLHVKFDQPDEEVDAFTAQLSPEQATIAAPGAPSPFEPLSDFLQSDTPRS